MDKVRADALRAIAKKPEAFVQPTEALAGELTSLLKYFFDYGKATEKKKFGDLKELYVDGFDTESIWEELQLKNEPLVKWLKKGTKRLVASEDLSLAANLSGSEDEDADEQEEDDEDDDDDNNEEEEEEEDGLGDGDEDGDAEAEEDALLERMLQGGSAADDYDEEEDEEDGLDDELEEDDLPRRPTGSTKRKATDDSGGVTNGTREGFFDMEEMERMGDETLAGSEDELSEDQLELLYGDGDADADAEDDDVNASYGEFFDDTEYVEVDKKGQDGAIKGGRRGEKHGVEEDEDDEEEGLGDLGGDDENDDEEEEDEAGNDMDELSERKDGEKAEVAKTPFMRSKANISSHISELEAELMAEKPWELKGEVKAAERPENSLLEAVVDVERATRVAPAVTVEKTATLEDMIRQRCLEEKWDDVVPRHIQLPTQISKEVNLSEEKNQEGLAEIYEAEYAKRTLGIEKNDPQEAAKQELKGLFAKLCHKLDALTNFHFTPTPVIPDMKVQADVPAIAMEEALPISVSDATAKAPEEVYAKKRGREGEFLEEDEMDGEDRKRARGQDKAVRRKKRKHKKAEESLVQKLNPGLGNKYEKSKVLDEIRGAKNVVTGDTTDAGKKSFSTSANFFADLQKGSAGSSSGSGDRNKKKEKRQEKKAAELRL